MKKYIAYFDLLGYKQFIVNNSLDYVKKRMLQVFRDIELAKGQGKTTLSTDGRVIADISTSKLHSANFSDTIVFWSQDDSLESLNEILEVAFTYNWQGVTFFFPLRGVLLYDEIESMEYRNKNDIGGSYRISTLFGKGIVHAYQISESLNWAGSVIDSTVVEQAKVLGQEPSIFFHEYALWYPVPYKGKCKQCEQFAFRLVKGDNLNKVAFRNVKKGIQRCFSDDNKDASSRRARILFNNTVKFLSVVKSK
jgi:hypothetical protein